MSEKQDARFCMSGLAVSRCKKEALGAQSQIKQLNAGLATVSSPPIKFSDQKTS